MIQVQLKRILKKRKRSMYWLAQEIGSHYPSVWRLAEGQAVLLNLETLDRICEALECEPGDLLVRIERRKARKRN